MTRQGRQRECIRDARSGFALLAALWVVTVVAVISVTISLVARDAFATSRNRVALVRAAWRAEDCAARALSAIGDTLAAEAQRPASLLPTAWEHLDVLVAAVVGTRPDVRDHADVSAPCTLTLEPIGAALDVNVASGAQLRRLFSAAGLTPVQADSLTAALLDWRDEDDIARTLGAEREWYEQRQRVAPRNAGLADLGEVRLVRGFDALRPEIATRIIGALTVEAGRPSLTHARPLVLVALFGQGADTLPALRAARGQARQREIGTSTIQLSGEPAWLSRLQPEALPGVSGPSAAAPPDAGGPRPESLAMTTEVWLLAATGVSDAGTLRVTATVEYRITRGAGRVAVLRRRTDP
jgi:hypothetical protein